VYVTAAARNTKSYLSHLSQLVHNFWVRDDPEGPISKQVLYKTATTVTNTHPWHTQSDNVHHYKIELDCTLHFNQQTHLSRPRDRPQRAQSTFV
jgi:hypothetical protein